MYPCTESKGADVLPGYHAYVKISFSHDKAHIENEYG